MTPLVSLWPQCSPLAWTTIRLPSSHPMCVTVNRDSKSKFIQFQDDSYGSDVSMMYVMLCECWLSPPLPALPMHARCLRTATLSMATCWGICPCVGSR